MQRAVFCTLLMILPLVVVLPNLAQPRRRGGLSQSSRLGDLKGGVNGREFTFTRLEYGSGLGRRWERSWMVDWPKADEQFIVGLRGWVQSLLPISDTPATVAIDDPALFTYPFTYIVEPGYMMLSDEEAKLLREYLNRGGFLMLDDFWGEYEWQNVKGQMHKIFPEYPVRSIALDHPVFHCYFDIREVLQVPNYHNWIRAGRTDEKGGTVPSFEVIEDGDGRIVVFIARNSDNGDAWEWIDQPDYPLRYGLAAYRLGMNLIVYSMTH